MNIKKTLIFALLLALPHQNSMACIRTDLDDRTPQEVLKKSLVLATQGNYSHVTGAINLVTGPYSIGTGVALNRNTILTAAHLEQLKSQKEFYFIRDTNLHSHVYNKKNQHKISSPVIIHPGYKTQETEEFSIQYKEGEWFAESIPLKTALSFTFSEFDNSPLIKYANFSGVDLAILKLDTPLSGDELVFPEILDSEVEISGAHALSLGYGAMKYNNQEKGPVFVTNEPKKMFNRHLISSTVNNYNSKILGPIFHGSYQGLMINGDESFIHTSSMLKTEGLPVLGDSGGPLFIQHDNQYKLSGILSSTWSICSKLLTDKNSRSLLKDFVQPIFPAWIDIRPYKNWILENMQK